MRLNVVVFFGALFLLVIVLYQLTLTSDSEPVQPSTPTTSADEPAITPRSDLQHYLPPTPVIGEDGIIDADKKC
jgi:hypothetical protein